jgi:integrase
MTISKKRLSISYYLLSPKAKTQSVVYVSLSKNKSRLRFTTGESFFTSYCNVRRDEDKPLKGKPFKELLKRNTVFYLEYKLKLEKITNMLTQIDIDLSKKADSYDLIQIRDQYYLQAGLIEVEKITFTTAWTNFVAFSCNKWQESTMQHFNALKSHLLAFKPEITLEDFTVSFWDSFRDEYFVDLKKFSNNSINKNLKKLKQFLHYLNGDTDTYTIKYFDIKQIKGMKYLDEIEPYKIALKLHEVETLAKMDMGTNTRWDKVRDLFLLEIMTGQRFSDVHKILDKNNLSENSITIYQQKGKKKVSIPLHPKLKTHLKEIFDKYPEGLPVITNQNFNSYLKEFCKEAGFTRTHKWQVLSGITIKEKTSFRYNLISSHTGRRTFCTLALADKIQEELIMEVTGHESKEQFREYVKVDDTDVNEAFGDKFMNGKK